jgi:hypothetical protein
MFRPESLLYFAPYYGPFLEIFGSNELLIAPLGNDLVDVRGYKFYQLVPILEREVVTQTLD